MGYFSSVAKSFKLYGISKRLGAATGTPSSFSVDAMMQRSAEHRAAIGDLIALIESREELRPILQDYGVDREKLEALYRALTTLGLVQWEGAHWLAASSLAFPGALEFTLRKFEREHVVGHMEQAKVAFRLLAYFKNHEYGWIRE